MRFSIIISTYPPHFHRVSKFLASCYEHIKDLDKLDVILVVSSGEEYLIRGAIEGFVRSDIEENNRINFKIVTFSKLLKDFYGINITEQEMLTNMCDPFSGGKWSYQSLKKLIGVLYSDNPYSLVIDSETLVIRDCYIEDVFLNFFNKSRTYFYTDNSLEKSPRFKNFGNGALYTLSGNCNKILKKETLPFYFWEAGNWFFEKEKVEGLVKYIEGLHGTNIVNVMLSIKPIFEFSLYQFYLYHMHRDQYTFVCVNDEIRSYVNNEVYFLQQRDRLTDTRLGFEETLTILDNDKMADCYHALFTRYDLNFLMFGISWDRCTSQHVRFIEETENIKFLCTLDSENGPITRGLSLPKLNKVIT